MATPRVSVVIPTYNRQDLIVEAIESVLAQTYTDLEIVVVDDGSTDDTEASIRPYLDRIVYTKQQNRGVAAARNAGIMLSRGEYICFLDSDDLWMPDKLADQIGFADAHPEYGLLSSDLQGFDADGNATGRSKSAIYEIRNGLVVERLLLGNWIQTSTVMLRRKCLDEVGWFDEDIGQFGEDWLLWMRVASQYPIYFMPKPLVSYRFHSGRLTLHKREEQFQSLMLCLERMSDFPQFQRRPRLLHDAEYRICLGRGKYEFETGEYERAIAKLKRASKLRKFSVASYYFLMRASIESKLKGNGRSSSIAEDNFDL